MSAAISQHDQYDGQPFRHDDSQGAAAPVVVRRNAGLAALVGAGASAIAIAYLWRATASAAPLDWALCLLMAGIAAYHLANLVDARTPLLVADDLGVRIRLGNQWRGLPWDAVERVVVQPRRGAVKDGRLLFAPHSLARALDGLDARGRRAAALNQKMYGAALAVPMGLTTRVSVQGEALADGLAALSQGRVDVVVLRVPEPADRAEDADPAGRTDEAGVAEGLVADATEGPDTAHPADRAAERRSRRGLAERFRSRGVRADGGVPAEQYADTDLELPAEDDRLADAEPDATDTATGSPTDGDAGTESDADAGPVHRSRLGGLGMIVSRVAKGRAHDLDVPATDGSAADQSEDSESDDADHADESGDLVGAEGPDGDAGIPAPGRTAARGAVPMRETRHAVRAQVTRDTPATVLGNAALLPDPHEHGRRPELPEGRELRRPGSVDLEYEAPDAWHDAGRVRRISALGEPVEALVIDDFVTEPAYDPVIGPELAAARTRVGLSVDELAERTRIRPHVIESIEVDDFAPCGGDFYARGHLRTLARVLGREPGPLLEQFDQRYATAPINARRVFEAELATGMTGSMRSTVGGGPNWALMVGVVLALVLTWGVIRLFAAQPQENLQELAPVLSGSAGVGNAAPAGAVAPAPTPKPIRVTLVGAHAGSGVVVRDRDGKVVWAGKIVLGERRTVSATPPVKVKAQDAGALDASVNGRDKGSLGTLGQPGTRTFVRPAAR